MAADSTPAAPDNGPTGTPDTDPAPPPDTESTARPPDWSTPDTPAEAPPIGGDPTPSYADPPASSADPPSHADPPSRPDQPASWLDQPRSYPRERPPQRRQLWLLIGISVALVLCCCAGVVGTALTWGRDLAAEVQDRGQRIIGLNQPGRDGDLEFLVYAVECGLGRIGDPLINQAAVGQFCVVELAVRNIGKRPAFFTDSLQLAYGPDGQQFAADSGASILANADQQVFLSEINPGNQVTGAVVYDIPPDSRIVRLRLHHSPSSPGLVVRTG
jgi:hypothetical protein